MAAQSKRNLLPLLLFTASLLPEANPAFADLDGRSALAVSYRPSATELVDLDADLDLDLVVLCAGEFAGNEWQGCVLYVFTNPGDGLFGVPMVYELPSAPYGFAVGDLDGDLDPDLVTANAAPDNLQVLINDGQGQFDLGSLIPVGADPRAVVAADLDGDLDLDLASADQFGFGVSVAYNDGDATFGVVDFLFLGDLVNGIQSGDVDGDEDEDLLALTNGGAWLLRNNGAGGFAAEPLGLGAVDAHARLALCNGDAQLDLVTGARVWLGNGDGTFSGAPVLTGLADGPVRCWRFDGDDYRDIVTGAGVARGTAGSGFEPPIGFDPPPDSGPIACGDFSGDNAADLVRLQAGIAGPIGFAVLLPGNGDGSVPVFARVPAGDSVWDLTTADVDGDNNLDVLVANIGTPWGSFLNGSISVLTGNGDGSINPLVSYAAGDYVRRVVAGNLEIDPLPELVVTNFNDATASLLINNGAGGYGARIPLPVGANPEALTIGDFNGDQHPDLAVTNYGLGATPAAVTVLFLDGDAGVLSSATIDLTGHAAVALAGVDLNNDQALDLSVACAGRYYAGGYTHFGLYVRLNNGDGTFAPETHYATNYLPRTLNPARGDHEGAPDLVVTAHGPTQAVLYVGEVVTFRNDGQGHFPSAVTTPLTHDHFSAACRDLDGDGFDDLAVPYLSAAAVSILSGDGGGGFPHQTHYATGAEPRAVVLGNFDADGRPDLAVAHGEINELGLLLSVPPAAGIEEAGRATGRPDAALVRSLPNPFRHTTRIHYDLPAHSPMGDKAVAIYDLLGRCVARLRGKRNEAGTLEVLWDGCDHGGRRLPAGVYTSRLCSDPGGAVHRLIFCGQEAASWQ